MGDLVALRQRYPVQDPNGFFQIINRKIGAFPGDVEWFELTGISHREFHHDTEISVTYKTSRMKNVRHTEIYIHDWELIELGRRHFMNLAPWYLIENM